MLAQKLKNKRIILASRSPRRKELLEELGVSFTVESFDVEENVPQYLQAEEIPVYLAAAKVAPFKSQDLTNTIVIGCDTVVILDGKTLNKPRSSEEAAEMLEQLSGKEHQVISGACILHDDNSTSFWDSTKVRFRTLTAEEIEFYIDSFKPFDKAGAYGIQEWMGHVGIEGIEGDFYNVMGLPTRKVYKALMEV